MQFSKVITSLSLFVAGVHLLPFPQVDLLSELPKEPIEPFAEWAWGLHPNGLGYKARNSLTVDQCLKNKKMINTPACKLPTELCIKFPEFAPMIACQDALYPKEFCLANTVLVSAKGCQKHLTAVCSSSLDLATSNPCADAEYPQGFCVSNPVLVGAKGCRPYLSAVCSTGVEVATKPVCADAEYPKDFCVSNPVLIKAKGCAPYKTDLCSLSVELAESPACAGAADDITYLQCIGDGAVCRAKICDKRVPNKDFCKPA